MLYEVAVRKTESYTGHILVQAASAESAEEEAYCMCQQDKDPTEDGWEYEEGEVEIMGCRELADRERVLIRKEELEQFRAWKSAQNPAP